VCLFFSNRQKSGIEKFIFPVKPRQKETPLQAGEKFLKNLKLGGGHCKEETQQAAEKFLEAVKYGDLILYEETGFSNMQVFPREDIFDGKNKVIEAHGGQEKELIRIYFRSPAYTWGGMCGREGPLAICPKCARQVKFVRYAMN
jgi:hypothetical protein